MARKTKRPNSPSKDRVLSEVSTMTEKQSRVEILQSLSSMTGLKRIDVEAVFEAMLEIVSSHMRPEGSGEIIIPKLGIKVKRILRKPTKDRMMLSPLTGTEVSIEGKPSRNDVKLLALKPIKETLKEVNLKSNINRPKVFYCQEWKHNWVYQDSHNLDVSLIEDPMGVIPTGT